MLTQLSNLVCVVGVERRSCYSLKDVLRFGYNVLMYPLPSCGFQSLKCNSAIFHMLSSLLQTSHVKIFYLRPRHNSQFFSPPSIYHYREINRAIFKTSSQPIPYTTTLLHTTYEPHHPTHQTTKCTSKSTSSPSSPPSQPSQPNS